MKKWFFILISIVAFGLGQQIQPGETFKQKNAKNYRCYMDYNVKSISFYISSPSFIKFMDKNGLENMHYLLKVKWEPSGTFTFSYDSLIKKIPNNLLVPVFAKLDTIRNQFWGSTFDMQSFLMENPLNEIPMDAEFWGGGDSVAYQYTTMDKGQNITIRRVFLITNGLILKQLVGIDNQLIFVYPDYIDINKKWQCTGWETQITENGKIVGGMVVKFDFVRIKDDFIFPEKIQYIVKVPDKKDEFFVSELFLYKIHVEYNQ